MLVNMLITLIKVGTCVIMFGFLGGGGVKLITN